MTNGENILSAFPNATIRKCKNKDFIYIEVEQNDKWIADFDMEWWNAEYKEPTIKSLEQEPILDKIRAEIEEKSYLSYDDNPRHIIDESWVIEIIDKYRAESKPWENDIEKRKPCINYEDGCEEWAGCPCVYYKTESEDKEV